MWNIRVEQALKACRAASNREALRIKLYVPINALDIRVLIFVYLYMALRSLLDSNLRWIELLNFGAFYRSPKAAH